MIIINVRDSNNRSTLYLSLYGQTRSSVCKSLSPLVFHEISILNRHCLRTRNVIIKVCPSRKFDLELYSEYKIKRSAIESLQQKNTIGQKKKY